MTKVKKACKMRCGGAKRDSTFLYQKSAETSRRPDKYAFAGGFVRGDFLKIMRKVFKGLFMKIIKGDRMQLYPKICGGKLCS